VDILGVCELEERVVPTREIEENGLFSPHLVLILKIFINYYNRLTTVLVFCLLVLGNLRTGALTV
jgi:hypothetical protein